MAWSSPALDVEEPLGRALAGEERVVAFVDVVGQQSGAVGVGARDDERRHAQDVGGQPGRH